MIHDIDLLDISNSNPVICPICSFIYLIESLKQILYTLAAVITHTLNSYSIIEMKVITVTVI